MINITYQVVLVLSGPCYPDKQDKPFRKEGIYVSVSSFLLGSLQNVISNIGIVTWFPLPVSNESLQANSILVRPGTFY
jgi:hypothetical protein